MDISNSFEIRLAEGGTGDTDIDMPFLQKKLEQCEWQCGGSMCTRACASVSKRCCVCSFTDVTASLIAVFSVPCDAVCFRAADKQTFPQLELAGWYATGTETTDADMIIQRKVGAGGGWEEVWGSLAW